MLQLHNLSYRWPGATQSCLTRLSLRVSPGEWVALVGDNGAGKSTLLRLAAGLLRPDAGQALLNGKTLADYSAPQRACRIGVLFQEAERQIFHSKVIDEVAFGLRRQKLPAKDILQRSLQALDECGLADVAQSHPLDLHAGQRRMVAVASLSAVAPPLLLLDEPSRDFDARWLARFERWLAARRTAGTAIVAISHDLDFIARHFNRVVRLSQGMLVADGAPAEVLDHAELQQASPLPAPTLFSLSRALDMALENDPQRWADRLLSCLHQRG